ncbi:BTB/POZ domain-containing protein NPY2 [Hibiscus syriacus]|uniref:BTB/POZ domain-containing protein NPY2 n=1 Tax=Hibiscus syriacus TaxID=106335 RepID=A0A6A3AEP0_HIBSY|nr:BTB/POZ domain-containing protein NPY2-like [Hibiscus syriacus]KAE8702217.1 BTB/POZ domain-containing protein NPY2 [Hibiscus syriacus]
MKFMKIGSKPDTFRSNGKNVRYVASELATDVVIVVGDVEFYLHKFPLLSKSASLQKLIANDENGDEIQISDIPGGSVAFEICVKFCYGIAITLNAYNVIAARCAAEYLGMHETTEKGNLVYKIDAFLNSSIFRSWKDSIIVLQTTKSVLPLPEESVLVGLCIDAIAAKACSDVSKVNWSYSYNQRRLSDDSSNGIRSRPVPKDWWIEDLCKLEIDLYKRIMMKIKTKGILSHVVIGEALKAYSYIRLPGFSEGVIYSRDAAKYRSTVDTIIWLLPAERGSVPCSFLLKLLKVAIIVDSGEMTTELLVCRIRQQLKEVSLNDILMQTPEGEVTYDVDVVQKIVQEFLMQDQNSEFESEENEILEIERPGILTDDSKLMVAKLIDAYLAEIAKDPRLTLSKFIDLAEMVSGISRTNHDRLYRAIDVYLKEHPVLSKSERTSICKLMDYNKLSVDARMHAVQNERLPSRVVMQVVLFDQVRAAASLGGNTRKDQNGLKKGSHGSTRAAATNPEEDRDAPATSDEINGALTFGNGAISKVKSLLKSARMFKKVWSSKGSQYCQISC